METVHLLTLILGEGSETQRKGRQIHPEEGSMKTKAGRECLATRKRVGEEKLNADNQAADMLYLARRGYPFIRGLTSTLL